MSTNIIFILIFLYGISAVYSECTIYLESDPLKKPSVWKQFGSRKLKTQTTTNSVILENGSELMVTCAKGFESPSGYVNVKKLSIECRDYIYIYSNLYNGGNHHMIVRCQPQTTLSAVKVFETATPFSWCNRDYASYIVAGSGVNDEYSDNIAAICYDFNRMSLISIYHSLRNVYNKNLSPRVLKHYKLGKESENIWEIFGNKSLNASMYDTDELQNWYNFSNYQYSSIVQNKYISENIFKGFGSFIDVIWWPNLRYGNWKRYEDNLAKQNEREPFNVMAGVSEIVKVPIKNDCNNNLSWVELKDNMTPDHVPLFVWNYLESSTNETNKFVIIGINTPLFEDYIEKDLIFCKDICNTIEWLANIQAKLRRTTMGIIFCCSVNEVKKSKRLNGFPVNITISNPEPTPAPTRDDYDEDDLLFRG